MIIAFEIKKLIFFIKFIIIEFEFTIVNLILRIFLFLNCFKKTIEIFFLKNFNILFYFENYNIKNLNKLIILIINIDRSDMFHN